MTAIIATFTKPTRWRVSKTWYKTNDKKSEFGEVRYLIWDEEREGKVDCPWYWYSFDEAKPFLFKNKREAREILDEIELNPERANIPVKEVKKNYIFMCDSYDPDTYGEEDRTPCSVRVYKIEPIVR